MKIPEGAQGITVTAWDLGVGKREGWAARAQEQS